MVPTPGFWPDWRRELDYASLLGADRSVLAWEWLRRQEGYRRAWDRWAVRSKVGGGQESPSRWGLHRLEDPGLPVPAARPLWRREVLPSVIQVEARPDGPPSDRFDLARFAEMAAIHREPSGDEHVLLSDGFRGIRMDVVEGSVSDGHVMLSYRLSGLASAEAPLASLRRLLALSRTGRFSTGLHSREVRAPRWIAMLRAYDAILAGVPQREIAFVLLSSEAASSRWRIEASTLRSRVQRIVRSAREMAAGGYLELLAGGP